MLQCLSAADFQHILPLYRACGAWLSANGFENWGDFYPTEAIIRADLEAQNLFGWVVADELVGVVVVDEVTNPFYPQISWKYSQAKPAFVHRLAVHPAYQGKGYGQSLMLAAESIAQARKLEVLRLDVYEPNHALQRFYTLLGYENTGQSVYLGEPWVYGFVCFEKFIG